MADEIENQLAGMIEKAPMVAEIGDEGFQETPITPQDQQAAPPVEKTAEQVASEAAKQGDENDINVIRQRLADIEKKAADKDGQAASERAKRRAAEAQAKQLQEQMAAVQQQIAAAQARQRMAGTNIPDPEENVVEALKYERALRLANEQQQAQRMQQYQQQQQQINFINDLKTTVEDFEAEFREANPDYDEAAEWLVDIEQKRLEMAGTPKQQAEQYAINWAINMTNMMVQQGKNPAQVAYEAAKMMGWKPKDGQSPSPAQQAINAAAQGQQKLATQKAGQEAAKTLSGGGSVAPNNGDSLSSGLQLKGAAFDAWAEKFLGRS